MSPLASPRAKSVGPKSVLGPVGSYTGQDDTGILVLTSCACVDLPCLATMNRPLTNQQQAVYDFIRDKIVSRGYGPTVREIGEHMNIKSPNCWP